MSKQISSVDWLINELTQVDYNCINKTFLQNNNSLAGHKMKELFKQAKAMHKEEIEEAFASGIDNEWHINKDVKKKPQQYYNETFEK